MLSFAVTLLLASQASASVLSNVVNVVRRDDSVEHSMRRYVDSIMEPVEKRSAATGVNATEWAAQTAVACESSMTALNGKTNNPSGMAICYNVAYLDNTTGVFEADLRLYMIAAPTGDFAAISSSNVQVGLAYNGATVSPLNPSAVRRSDESVTTSLMSWPRRDETSSMQKRMTPTLVQGYCFVGQINKDLLTTAAGTTSFQKVLVPEVTLTGKSVSGAMVNTTLASDEATFVTGVFAAQVTPTKSQVVAPIQTLVVASDKPFVLPGVNILIFPIGGIITGTWAILFISTIAYGTFGRMQFREQFRSRKARQQKGNLARI